MVSWFLTGVPRKLIVISTNDALITGYPHAKEGRSFPHAIYESYLNVDHRHTSKSWNYKLREENIKVNLYDVRLGNGFLDMIPKVQETAKAKEKINKTL